MVTTSEQRFKRKVRKVIRDRWNDLTKKQVDCIADDVWLWFEEHNHQANMKYPDWVKILEKNKVRVR